MNFLGFEVKRAEKALQSVDNRGGWWGIVRESFTGAWQSNVEVRLDTVLTQNAVFRCVSLISSDTAKMRVQLMSEDGDGVMVPVKEKIYSPVLKKPNRFQTRIQFFESWVESKLTHGNTYVLKQRDSKKNVVAMYVLDATKVKVLVSDDGSVFYRLNKDDLNRVDGTVDGEGITVPASEIIHDRWNTLYHPLVGTSPIYACGLAAVQGLRIQNNSANFFGNNSTPGGVLTAPGPISDETAERLKTGWEANYSGNNAGKVAILGDNLSYQAMSMKATDSQLLEQLKWTAETVCSVFGVPPYKAGVGPLPAHNNIEGMDQQYYSQCLQIHIESIEILLDEGLGMPDNLRVQFNLDDLIRMDTAAKIEAEAKAVGAGVKAPNEARKKFNLGPVAGGEHPYLQQQNYSLEDLARRSESDDPEPISFSEQDQADVIRRVERGLS